MQVKNWKAKVVSAALALSVLASSAAFAADNATSTGDVQFKTGFAKHQRFDGAKSQLNETKILEVVGKYAPESLSDWESVLAEREQLANELKEKAPIDRQRVKLTDEQKEQVKAIREGVKNGTLTPEQAKEQLQSLGLDMARSFGLKPQLTDEQKEQVKAIREGVKNGTLTPEQAKEQLQSLGLQGKNAFARPDNLMGQFKEAVEANDESTIIELLPQLLEQMKERNQQLSDKLSKINQ